MTGQRLGIPAIVGVVGTAAAALQRPRLGRQLAICAGWLSVLAVAPSSCRSAGPPPLWQSEEVLLADLQPGGYPTRSRCFAGMRCQPSHGPSDIAMARADAQFYATLAQVPLGEVAQVGIFTGAPPQTWQNMGFEPAGEHAFRRVAALDAAVDLVPTDSAELPFIDCVVISSIHRQGVRPYIYDTLHSVFANFPDELQVNILVGSPDVDYLSEQALLAEGIAPAQLARLHLRPTTEADARYLQRHFPRPTDANASLLSPGGAQGIERRASWNYARALRSYKGERGLLLMEDDVQWAARGPQHLGRLQATERSLVLSLFEELCQQADPDRAQPIDMQHYAVGDHFRFFCTQAMLYSADVANELGRFMQTRMHGGGYDTLVERFLRRHHMMVSYVHPSLVQHTGRHSCGLSSRFPYSQCFEPELPPWPDAPRGH